MVMVLYTDVVPLALTGLARWFLDSDVWYWLPLMGAWFMCVFENGFCLLCVIFRLVSNLNQLLFQEPPTQFDPHCFGGK